MVPPHEIFQIFFLDCVIYLFGCFQYFGHFFDLWRPQVENSNFPKAKIGTLFRILCVPSCNFCYLKIFILFRTEAVACRNFLIFGSDLFFFHIVLCVFFPHFCSIFFHLRRPQVALRLVPYLPSQVAPSAHSPSPDRTSCCTFLTSSTIRRAVGAVGFNMKTHCITIHYYIVQSLRIRTPYRHNRMIKRYARLDAAASREKNRAKSPGFGRDHVARSSSGLNCIKPLT